MHFSRTIGRSDAARCGVAWRGVKTRPADARRAGSRLRSWWEQFPPSSHPGVLDVRGKSGQKESAHFPPPVPLLSSMRPFSSSRDSWKLAEAQRCLAELGSACLHLSGHKYPQRCREEGEKQERR